MPGLALIAEHWARIGPERVVLRQGSAVTTWRRLQRRILRAAARLSGDWGVTTGTRVAYLGLNCTEEIVLLLALARIGAVLVPLNTRLAAPELRAILVRSGATIVLHDGSLRPQALQLARELAVRSAPVTELIAEPCAHETPRPHADPRAPLLLVFTSGSTGPAAGVLHSQEALVWNAHISIAAHQMGSADHVLTVLPLFHVGGMCIQTLPALIAGAQITLHERFDPAAWLADVVALKPTLSLMVPATLKAVIEHPTFAAADLSSLRLVMAGSSIIPESLLSAFHVREVPVGQVYGSTETGPVSVVLGAQDAVRKAGFAGWPALHCELRVVDAEGAACAVGEVGAIEVKGPNLMAGYLDEAGSPFTPDGWFRTGDLGCLDEEGCLAVVGRSSELIISGGENIYPAEVESLLAQHEAVAEVAVVGVADDRWGEVPLAVVVAKSGARATAADILDSLEGRIATFKRPRRLCFVESLPRTALGKVARAQLTLAMAAEAPSEPA